MEALHSLVQRSTGREAVVEPGSDGVRHDVVCDAALDPGHGEHLHERQTFHVDLRRRDTGERVQPVDGHADRVDAEPRPGRMGADSTERERCIEVAEAAGLDRVVRGLEHDGEIRLAQVGTGGEDPGQRALGDRQLLAREEEQADVELAVGAVAVEPARELEHDCEPALHVSGAQAHHPAVLDPAWEVVLGRNRVQVAHEQDLGASRASLRRVVEAFTVGVSLQERSARHRVDDQLGQTCLVATHRRHVDEGKRTVGEPARYGCLWSHGEESMGRGSHLHRVARPARLPQLVTGRATGHNAGT